MKNNEDSVPVISLQNLTCRFGTLVSVDDLSLSIQKGEIYGFLGLNGAGKTTTIRMILGMIKPTSGTASLFGTKISPGERSVWERVGYMVETPYSYPDLTVRENLEMIRHLRLIRDKKAVDEVMELLRLEREAGKPAGKLSLGNRQRLGLARALIHHPELLILDEPANGLDPAGIVEVRNLLMSLAEDHGTTIFISSHILAEIAKLATRIGIIHEGRLIQELSADQLKTREQTRLAVRVRNNAAAYGILEEAGIPFEHDAEDRILILEKHAMDHPENISRLLVEKGLPPWQLVTERGDLESYFLDLVTKKAEVSLHE